MAFITPNQHDQIVSTVFHTLITGGVPSERILRNQRIEIPGWHQADADLLVVGKDAKTIVWQIEVKVGGGIHSTSSFRKDYVAPEVSSSTYYNGLGFRICLTLRMTTNEETDK